MTNPNVGSNGSQLPNSKEAIAFALQQFLVIALSFEAPGHEEAILSGYRSSVRPLGKYKGQATADFVSSAAIAVWKRAAAGVGSAVLHHDAFDLALAMLQRVLAADVSSNSPVLEHAWVEDLGAIHFITTKQFALQQELGRVLCRGCGFFFCDGGAMRQHAQHATDSRCMDAAASEYYEKACCDDSLSLPPPLSHSPSSGPLLEADSKGSEKLQCAVVAAPPQTQRRQLEPGIVAARDGKLDLLRSLVDTSSWDPLQAVDHHGNGPLHWAAGSGHLDVCKWLVEEAGVALAQQSSRHHGRTALHWAARNGHADVCEWLLETAKGPFVDTETDTGETPLMLAAWQGHLDVCRLLVDAKADAHHLNTSGCNAMHKAARMDGASSSIEMLRFLNDYGVDCCVANNNGHNALHKAAQHGSREAVNWLLKDAGCCCRAAVLPDRDRNSPSALAYAAGHRALASEVRHVEDILWLVPTLHHSSAPP